MSIADLEFPDAPKFPDASQDALKAVEWYSKRLAGNAGLPSNSLAFLEAIIFSKRAELAVLLAVRKAFFPQRPASESQRKLWEWLQGALKSFTLESAPPQSEDSCREPDRPLPEAPGTHSKQECSEA